MWASRRVSTPHVGKGEIAKARMRAAAGIISRNGASNVFTTQVMGGYGAGTMHLYANFESMSHSMEVSANMMGDPAWAALNAEREKGPSAVVVGPDLSRLIAGTPNRGNTAMMVREYEMPRTNLMTAAGMMADAQKMSEPHGVNVTMWAPVISSEMNRAFVVYSAADMVALGHGVDNVGMSEEFQAMVTEASKLGTLARSFGMVIFK
ncbi:hypothetical protein N9M21_07460 [Alphaproteobacteria bacterium]|jgi:hypothetical protein|nr:hypothetical protein [Alphaproteobacteria bacterium]